MRCKTQTYNIILTIIDSSIFHLINIGVLNMEMIYVQYFYHNK